MITEAAQFYIATLLILYLITLIGALGLNLQFGTSGVWNFGFAVSIGAGGYVAALLTLGPASDSVGQEYLFGASLPFPIPWLGAMIAGGLVALAMGAVSVRRLRGDYQAIVLLVISVIATRLVQNQKPFVNGARGLGLIPQPFRELVDSSIAYQRLYLVLAATICVLVVFGIRWITLSPMGRIMRAVRDNPDAASALGKDPFRVRQWAMAIGGALGGLSGAMLAGYITGWSPASWLMLATFVLFTGIILGGSGNVWGVVFGIALIPIGFRELTRLLPQVGYPGLVEALSLAAIGVLALAVLWLRSKGVLPEKPILFERHARRSRMRHVTNRSLVYSEKPTSRAGAEQDSDA